MAETFSLEDARRKLAALANVETLRLLGLAERTAEEDRRMLDAAHTSLYLWEGVGTAVNRQRGLWLVSRVRAVLGDGAGAMAYAERCREVTAAQPDEMKDFDLAYAVEAVARAARILGETGRADALLAEAEDLGNRISGAKDREIFLADLRA